VPGVKIAQFLGRYPKVSDELLPDTAAQTATNCKLYSGDLIPYPSPKVVATTSQSGTTKTLYGLRDPDTDSLVYLSWATDVDIAVATANEENDQRFYYTGDGVPKVSNYELATTGVPPYPTNFYELGLPIPPEADTPVATAAVNTTAATNSFGRDAGGIATLTTTSAHGFTSGDTISVSGFTARNGTYSAANPTTVTITANHGLSNGTYISLDFRTGSGASGVYPVTVTGANTFTVPVDATGGGGSVSWDITSFNVLNVVCTVIDDTTLSYANPGFQVDTTDTGSASVAGAGLIDLAGGTIARAYLYTWYTPWEEESIGSSPSEIIYIKNGTNVTISGLPSSPPSGDNYIRGLRLYKTIGSGIESGYGRIQTLWYPTNLATVARTSNVSRVTLTHPHMFLEGDIFKISGCTDATFDITDGVVTLVVDDLTFEYSQVAADVASTSVAAGVLYHDVSELPGTTAARYWGDGGDYTFLDDFNPTGILGVLTSTEFLPPPTNLQGLTSIQNNIVAGFVNNQLYLSEAGRPHAWPETNVYTIEPDIVAIAPISGSALLVTDSYPYLVSGSDPINMTVQRIDARYPCVSRNSVVSMDYGVVYATHEGLAVYSTTTGPRLVTFALYNNNTWAADLDPTSIVAEYYGESYFASHSAGAFVFEQDREQGGFFVDCTYTFDASWYDSVSGNVYYTQGSAGDVLEWDNTDQPATIQEWKSKVLITADMINLGAARVVADWSPSPDTPNWEDVDTNWEATTFLWDSSINVEFKLWADKTLIYTNTLTDSSMFRLPTGYRTDTFEVSVRSDIRVRSIHLADTPLGLKEI